MKKKCDKLERGASVELSFDWDLNNKNVSLLHRGSDIVYEAGINETGGARRPFDYVPLGGVVIGRDG